VVGVSSSLLADACQACVQTPSKALIDSLGKKYYPHCSILVGSRKQFEHEFYIQNCFFSHTN